MRWCRLCGRVAALWLLTSLDSLVLSSPSLGQERDGTLTIAGRALRCGNMRNVLDHRLPNIGMAAPGVVVLNPHLLDRQPQTVRLFVFHHECGHHHVGASEVAADCWAAKQGARQGWLNRRGIEQVCRSFGNRSATPTHPSGASRCAALERCFAGVAGTRAVSPAGATGRPAAKLFSASKAVRSGVLRSRN
jgi:hypothetical protein